MTMIHIADGQNDKMIGHISFGNILSNKHRRSLQDNLETFNFETLADKRFSQHLSKRNRIIIPGEDGEFREFIIFEAGTDRIEKYVEVYTNASYLELKKAKLIAPHTTDAISAENHAQAALSGTEWQPRNITFKGVRTLIFDAYTNPFAYLKRIASEFELELDFVIEHDGNAITGRYVDMVEKVGMWRGRTVDLGKI